MREIKALTVDDREYYHVLAEADSVVSMVNQGVYPVIPDCYHESILTALATWKKIAEERQEHIDFMNDLKMEAGTFDGLDAPSGEGT